MSVHQDRMQGSDPNYPGGKRLHYLQTLSAERYT